MFFTNTCNIDESIFFFPTLYTITNNKTNHHRFVEELVKKQRCNNNNKTKFCEKNNKQQFSNSSTYVLCLSNGNYNQLVHIRKKEMYHACKNSYGFDRKYVKIV